MKREEAHWQPTATGDPRDCPPWEGKVLLATVNGAVTEGCRYPWPFSWPSPRGGGRGV